jgi:type I restriction enzyme M protein
MRDAQLAAAAEVLRELFGEELFNDHNHFCGKVQNARKLQGLKLSAVDLKLLLKQVSWREESAPPLEEGGIEAFLRREVLPYTPDAWFNPEATKVGDEVSFTRHFYKPKPLRSLAEIAADIRAIEAEAEGLLDGLLVGAG